MTDINDLGIETPLDKFDEVREYFDDEEWDAIRDRIKAEYIKKVRDAASALAPEEQQELLSTITCKIRILFDITGEIDR